MTTKEYKLLLLLWQQNVWLVSLDAGKYAVWPIPSVDWLGKIVYFSVIIATVYYIVNVALGHVDAGRVSCRRPSVMSSRVAGSAKQDPKRYIFLLLIYIYTCVCKFCIYSAALIMLRAYIVLPTSIRLSCPSFKVPTTKVKVTFKCQEVNKAKYHLVSALRWWVAFHK